MRAIAVAALLAFATACGSGGSSCRAPSGRLSVTVPSSLCLALLRVAPSGVLIFTRCEDSSGCRFPPRRGGVGGELSGGKRGSAAAR